MDLFINLFRRSSEPIYREMVDLSEEAREERLETSIDDAARELIMIRNPPHIPSFYQFICTFDPALRTVSLKQCARKREDFCFNVRVMPKRPHTQLEAYETDEAWVTAIETLKPVQESEAGDVMDRILLRANELLLERTASIVKR